MSFELRYESDGFLPIDVRGLIKTMREKISLQAAIEHDKLHIIVSGFERDLLMWFVSNAHKADGTCE